MFNGKRRWHCGDGEIRSLTDAAIASELSARLNTPVEVGGVEANMAVAGALTTHGCAVPLAILDLGAGSTDAAIINNDGAVRRCRRAG